MNKIILIVDDDKKIANLIDYRLKKLGHATHSVFRGADALEETKRLLPVLVMLDIRLPDTNGLEVLKTIKKDFPQTHVIMISAHADVKAAVECMKHGAYDFIEKPLAFPELDAKVNRVFEQFNLQEEVTMLKRELGEKYKYKNLIGKSQEMKKVFDRIDLASKSDVSVLIEGESGTGKELVARAIHFNGLQKEGPFIAVNCAAIPENLLESELFGHEKGSFTGALARRIGKFEQAQGGTLFLDEIGDLPPSLQVKLLRVLQEREIERIGGEGPVQINVRFIAATNRELKEQVRLGKFREDLYFRINVFPIFIPPLRQRHEDIPELLKYFFQKSDNMKFQCRMEPDALKSLISYGWPGNIRELENFVARLALIKKGGESITLQDVSPLLDNPSREPFSGGAAATGAPAGEEDLSNWREKEKIMGHTEKMILEKALQEAGGNISRASKLIRVSRDTFYRKMKKYSMQAPGSMSLPQGSP